MFPDGFQTNRLTLRPIAMADATLIFDGYAQDSDVTRFLTWLLHSRVAQTVAYVQHCMAAASSRTYVLISRNDEKLLGAFDLRQVRPHGLGFGYVLARSAWGQGLMAGHAMVNAFGMQSASWRLACRNQTRSKRSSFRVPTINGSLPSQLS